jgi:hypothetical protein
MSSGTYWWIVDGLDTVRVDTFERARDGACSRADAKCVRAVERDRHGDVTWYVAEGASGFRPVYVVRDDAMCAWSQGGAS